MRWVAALKDWREKLGLWSFGSAIVAICLTGPAIIVVYMYQACTVRDEGLVAEGVVVSGSAGTTPGDAYYCVEEISFKDQLGISRKTKRSCASDPELGAHVIVRYSASNPEKTYVDGDNNFAGIVFWSVIFGAWALWKLLWSIADGNPPWQGLFKSSKPMPPTEPEPFWDASAAEDLKRLGPVYPRTPKA